MTDLFYYLPIWLQIYVQIEKETFIRSLLRRTSKALNDKCLLIKDDFDYANSQLKIGWYSINKYYVLLADDSEEGIRVYNYYYKMFESSQLFLKTNF